MTYDNFIVFIQPGNGGFEALVFSSPEGEQKAFTPLNLEALNKAEALQAAFREAVSRREAARATQTARDLGTALFNALFPDEPPDEENPGLRTLLQRNLDKIVAHPNRGLRIKLQIPIDAPDSGLPHLATLPWELLYHPQKQVFFNEQKATPVVRHLRVGESATPPPFKPPLRILVAMANPRGTRQLDLNRERRTIEKHVANQRGIEVDFIEHASQEDIANALEEAALPGNPYHVFHFMGHGIFSGGKGFLTLDDGSGADENGRRGQGKIDDVPEEDLRRLLGDRAADARLSLVFLNACETAQTNASTTRGPRSGSRGSGPPGPKPPGSLPPITPWRQAAPWAQSAMDSPWQLAVPWARPAGSNGLPFHFHEPTPSVPPVRSEPVEHAIAPEQKTHWREAAPWTSLVRWAESTPWSQAETGTRPRNDAPEQAPAAFSGIASVLVDEGITAVVAMQVAISDSAAIAFARGFYEQLRLSGSVDNAVTVGRKAIAGTPRSKPMEWSTPVLFMRAPDGKLFDRKTLPPILEKHRDLEILLNRVNLFWLEGVMKPAIPGPEPISLLMETVPEAIDNPLRSLDAAARTSLPSGMAISEVFDDARGELLILGDPGSGKTITLLALARALMPRAEGNLKAPTPVVFDLAHWTNTRLPLATWMIGELVEKYQIPANKARTWLKEHRLVPLLDGLDAVEDEHREACVQAINTYLQETGAAGIAVTCRTDDYEALNVKLKFPRANADSPSAVRLLPLTTDQIESYGEQANPPLKGFKTFLQDNPALREQAQSPLMLHLMSRAFGHDTAEAQASASSPPKREALHKSRLLDTYVDRMLTRQTEPSFSRKDTTRWLGFLAERMRANHQNIFLIENLKPDWFSTAWQRLLGLAILSVVLGLIIGFITWVALEASVQLDPPVDRSVNPPIPLVPHLPSFWFWWLVHAVWIFCLGALERYQPLGLGRATKGRLRGLLQQGMQAFTYYEIWIIVCLSMLGLFSVLNVMEHTPWSAATPWNSTAPWIVGLLVVLIYTAHPGKLTNTSMVQTLGWSWKNAVRGLAIGLHGGLAIWLAYVGYVLAEGFTLEEIFKNLGLYLPLGAIGGFLFTGLTARFMKGQTDPNQGLSYSIKSARRAGLLFGLIMAVACWVIFFVLFSEDYSWNSALWAVPAALGFGFIVLLIAGLWFGGKDVLRHYIIRIPIRMGGQMPGRKHFIPFLDEAARLGFLRKVGGGYRFIHSYLQDHFAEKREP